MTLYARSGPPVTLGRKKIPNPGGTNAVLEAYSARKEAQWLSAPAFLIPPFDQMQNPVELRENLGRVIFLAFLFVIYITLFFLPQLARLI